MELNTIISFLNDLRRNNNREWFKENENKYRKSKELFEHFLDILIPPLHQIDASIDVISSKDCIFRIYRDVRFSKNKEPYKNNFGAFISKGGRKSPYAGYYIHIEPGSSFIGGGIYMPESKILNAIRTEIYNNTSEYKSIINDPSFKKYFPAIFGEKLKMAPKGFPKDFEDIELLKNKHYALAHNVKDEFWSDNGLFDNIMDIFKTQYPFNRFMNEAVEKAL